MLSVNNGLMPEQVKQILVQTADFIGNDPFGLPMRRLNAGRAVEFAQQCLSDCILLDGDPGDWTGISPLLTDAQNDGPVDANGTSYPGLDILNIFATNDSDL